MPRWNCLGTNGASMDCLWAASDSAARSSEELLRGAAEDEEEDDEDVVVEGMLGLMAWGLLLLLDVEEASLDLVGDAGGLAALGRLEDFHCAACEGSVTVVVTVFAFCDCRATLKRFGLLVLCES